MAENGINVCNLVVQNDMCIGCGICSGLCPTKNLPMQFDQFGAYVPVDQGDCLSRCTICLDACPFLDHDRDEDSISKELYGGEESIGHHEAVGYYTSAYAGYVSEGDYRALGSSGGLARWFLAELLESGTVDHVACVESGSSPDKLFQFAIFDNATDLRAASKSAYYPVELSDIVRTILKQKGRYAIIGLPCYLKGLRLAMANNRRLRERVVLLAGMVCGQLKTTGYAEYLTRLVGMDPNNVSSLSFREKDLSKPATDLVFRVTDQGSTASLLFSQHASVWTTGQFKPSPCTFCDDVFAEVADVVFLDAWLPEYHQNGKGTSIVVLRSTLANEIIRRGIGRKALHLEPLSIERTAASQAGVITEKHTKLAYRLWLADRSKRYRPQKRVKPRRPGLVDYSLTILYEKLRQESHAAMGLQRNSSATGLAIYHSKVDPWLRRIKMVLRARIVVNLVHHKLRGLSKRITGRS